MPHLKVVSKGTERIFRLREVIPKAEAGERQAQTFNIPLQHNSVGPFFIRLAQDNCDRKVESTTSLACNHASAHPRILQVRSFSHQTDCNSTNIYPLTSLLSWNRHSIPSVNSIDVFRPPFPKTPGSEIESHNERINITFRSFDFLSLMDNISDSNHS